jgi:hypothetical protein
METHNTLKKRKVICFDGWTEGCIHFERHVEAFRNAGFEMILVHYGSWGHDKGRPKEESIGKLLVRDISYYSNSLLKILNDERPDIVLFLSTRNFINMAFNRYAKFLGVPTCLIYHGLISVQDTTLGDSNPYKFSKLRYLTLIRERMGKNLTVLIPKYLYSMAYTKASLSVWVEALSLIRERVTGRWTQNHYADSSTDFGCIWAQIDTEHMADLYRIPKSRIFIIGNPDLLKFNVKSSDVLSCYTNISLGYRQVVYIETAFNDTGVVYSDDLEFIHAMVVLKEELATYSFDFKLKLHPANNSKKELLDGLMKNDVEVVSDNDFIKQLKMSAGAIVEPSSAVIVPCILGLPIYFNNIGSMRSIPFGDMLHSYPNSTTLNTMSDLALICTNIENASYADYNEWINLYIGSVSAEDISTKLLNAIRHFC